MPVEPACTRRAIAGRLFFGAILVLAATAVAVPILGSDAGKGGASAYTPTQGEWLWLVLNTERALVDSEQEPLEVSVRYLYDRSKPNTIQIELLVNANAAGEAVRRQAAAAQERAKEAAKIRGWDGWLKIEFQEKRLTGLPQTETLYR